MALLKYPYTNLHELNLDWLIEQLNNPDGPVRSVNGKSGIVTLTGEDMARSTSNPETVAAALQTQGSALQTVRNQIGVTPLPTVAQTLTGAIAENAQEIADIEDNIIGDTVLPTEAQTLTGAIAENADNIGGNAESITNINNKIGTTTMPTTAQTLTGAITENAGNINSLNTNTTPFYKENLGVQTAVSSSDWGTISQITLPAGAWLIIGECDFSTNQTGIRVMMITYSATDTANKPENSVLSTGRATLSRCRILRSNEETIVYLRAYQTSGESINCTGNLRCIRINTTWTT